MQGDQDGSTAGTSRESGLADAGLTRVTIGAFYDVYNELGYGFLEAVYRKALAVRLHERGLSVRQEVLFEMTYHGVDIGQYRAEVIVADSVVVEVKSVERLALAHHAQLSNYMRASGLGLGLLLNFGLQPTVKRRLISGRIRSDPI